MCQDIKYFPETDGALSKSSDEKVEADYGSLRLFWSDVIMLNMMTTKLLKAADPREIEKYFPHCAAGKRKGWMDDIVSAWL